MSMRYYTFEIEGEKVGFYEESDHEGVLSSNARMRIGDDTYENLFAVRHSDGRVTAYRIGESDWMPFNQEDDVYPTSAFPLLVTQAARESTLTYRRFHEGKGRIAGSTTLSYDPSTRVVSETVDGSVARAAHLRDDRIVQYDWGGSARSVLCASKEEAVAGTPWEHT